MSDELLKAARTCIRNGDWCNYDPIYWNEDAKMAAGVIVSADLAEHPADDEEPITAEWLAKHMKPSELSVTVYGYSKSGGGILLRIEPSHGRWRAIVEQDDQEIRLGPLRIRGDVRRLCTALGVPLEES